MFDSGGVHSMYLVVRRWSATEHTSLSHQTARTDEIAKWIRQ